MEEMEKRFLAAVAVSFLIVMAWTQLFAPAPAPAPAEAVSPEAPAADPAGEGKAPPPVPVPERAVAADAAADTVVSTDRFEVTFTNRGGRVTSWKLLAYSNDAGKPVELVPSDAIQLDRLPLSLWLPERPELGRKIDAALFVIDREAIPAEEGGPGERVRMRYAEAGGLEVTKTVEFHPGSYFVQVTASVADGGQVVPAWLAWGAGFGETAEGHEAARTAQYRVGEAILDRGGRVERYPKSKEKAAKPLSGDGSIQWAGMETTYFAALMLPSGAARDAVLLPETLKIPAAQSPSGKEESHAYLGMALAPGEGSQPPGAYTLFVGPKDYRLLKASGHDLDAVINFGWPVVREIAQGLFVALVWLHGYIGNYGLAIILITIAIRLGFLPLMLRAQVKMRQTQQKTKRIQPKMKAIRERYRKAKMDFQARQKMNEEIMALYRKEGVNPLGGLGGCLPMFLQLPFLYGFYQLLTVTIELRHAPFFGWIQDLSRPDPYYVTPILMGVTMLVQTGMSMSSVVDPAQRRMMFMMSIVFMVFFLNLPSGLVIYWLFSNLFGVGQQYLVNRYADQAQVVKKPRKARAAAS
jgi:YidC/Oxa1 family membrane protein insertase